ncbi:tail protein [Idiomarinaceae phage Phi1M2-2]|uniref:tail protein n=1 Tax=Idiomarinaceae phage Phi1M2-2 TaxID=1527515 RepID=UPI0004F79DB1|nr:tail protein [Idiomarinaceae phage Phi1M2-2]AIM40788.1 putative tail fiber protein [Idiomarinaceae phage Phi1M2-2]
MTGAGDSWPSAEGNLLEWIEQNAPDIADKRVIVELNGDVICDTGEHEDADKRCDVDVTADDNVLIRVLPQGIETATLVAIGIGFLASVAVTLLIPTPRIPNDAGEEKTSPNNQLNASRNAFRPREAIPDIAGEVISFPDFIQPSYYEYVNNRRERRELLCFGVGEGDNDRVRSESTELDPSAYTIYAPNDTIPPQLIVNGTNDVDGIEPVPADDPSVEIRIDGATIQSPNQLSDFNPNAVNISVGDIVEISMEWAVSENATQTEQGFFEVATVSSFGITVVGASWSSSETVGNVSGFIRNTSSEQAGQWFNTLGDTTTQLWVQVVAAQGLKSAEDSTLQIQFRIEYQKIDSAGEPIDVESATVRSITGNTRNRVAETFKITGLDPARYRVRVIRTTPSVQGGIDRIQIEDIQAVRSYQPHFGDVQVIDVFRTDTDQPLASRDSKINVRYRRLLEIFDPSTATFGAKTHTRSFAQYVMYLHMVRGRGELRDIDYEALFDIEQSLPEPLTRFDFTFDDRDVSLGERIATACNAARVRVYTIGNYTTFVREELKPVRQALFGRRDIAPNSMREAWNPHRSSEYDSVEIEYVNPDTNAPAYERRRINSSGAIEVGLGDYPNTMQLAGCRTQEQAANRADYEIRRMRYQRRNLSITALRNAQDVTPGMRVAVESINDSETFGGEILRVDGNVYYTSEKFAPVAGNDYYVYITDEMGAVSNQVPVSAVSGEPFAFEAEGLTAFVADGYEVQVGSRYVIATADDMEAQDWIVVSRAKPDEFGRVNLELVNYDERVYSED